MFDEEEDKGILEKRLEGEKGAEEEEEEEESELEEEEGEGEGEEEVFMRK